jgi:protease I
MRIACVLGQGFEDSEFAVPFGRFQKAGHDVEIVGLDPRETLKGKRGHELVQVDEGIDEVTPDDFDALLIPGGHSPDRLRVDDRMLGFARGFADKPIFAICHGPQLLISAGMVKGRKMTAWKTVQVDLKNAGADVVDEEVVVDDRLVTSRQPEDLDAFVRECLALIQNGAAAHV